MRLIFPSNHSTPGYSHRAGYCHSLRELYGTFLIPYKLNSPLLVTVQWVRLPLGDQALGFRCPLFLTFQRKVTVAYED